MRIFKPFRAVMLLAGSVAVSGCSGGRSTAAAPSAPRIACTRGDRPLLPDCTVETQTTPAGLVLTVRRGDGGFRRLLVTHDGRGVIAADGAQPAEVKVIDRRTIEVGVADDRYRLPATVGAVH